MNILLVDDDPEIRLVAGLVLRGAGYAVTEVGSAGQAVAECETRTFDVVLMDVMLGTDDGIETGRRLLEIDNTLRLVFLTGATRDAQMNRMESVNPAGIVHKPFDPGTLAETVHRMLEDDAS